MARYAAIYQEAQGRVRILVNNQNANLPVPTCPGWTVKDVVAHLTGVFDDFRRGNMENAASDEWTAAQVESRKTRSLADIGAEWHTLVHTYPAVFRHEYVGNLVTDLICHEFDIRGAIGNREARYLLDIRTSAIYFLNGVDHALRQENLPALRIQVEDKALTVGEGEPEGTVTLSWFELFRTVSGRRSRSQVEALPWEGDSWIWLDHLFILGPAESDIVE